MRRRSTFRIHLAVPRWAALDLDLLDRPVRAGDENHLKGQQDKEGSEYAPEEILGVVLLHAGDVHIPARGIDDVARRLVDGALDLAEVLVDYDRHHKEVEPYAYSHRKGDSDNRKVVLIFDAAGKPMLQKLKRKNYGYNNPGDDNYNEPDVVAVRRHVVALAGLVELFSPRCLVLVADARCVVFVVQDYAGRAPHQHRGRDQKPELDPPHRRREPLVPLLCVCAHDGRLPSAAERAI